MYQLIQNYRTGKIELADVPVPQCKNDYLLVKNVNSLISIGTEKSIIELGKKSLLGKARQRPDLVKRFIEKAKTEGFIKTFKEALGRLDNPTPLGYSSSGIVVEVGENINKYSPGDRVACIGAGYASHAEYITVPENLCCKIPDNVSFEEASFGMLGIIAMHGVRSAGVTFGEKVAVLGLGLLGLLTVQILKAYGCSVIGYDIDPDKVVLSERLGIDGAFNDSKEFGKFVGSFTNGYGADSVIITASTESDKPINLAVDVSRMRAKIVVVGVCDIHPIRNEMWHKEVEIIVSKAGGPGILDPIYEIKGIDYPIGYVRWTENRNLEEFIRLISESRMRVKDLITHRFEIKEAVKVYDNIIKDSSKYIGVVLNYPDKNINIKKTERLKQINIVTKKDSKVKIGVIGAGLFGKALFLPSLKKVKDVELIALSTSSSSNVYYTGRKYGFKFVTTNYKDIINNESINAVIILTPHSLHKKMVIESLLAGKHVFVEKPIAINELELNEIIKVYNGLDSKPILTVGYNRRYSNHSKRVSDLIAKRNNPIVVNYMINAGYVPPEHWVHSPEEGGGRIVGEVCHFMDLLIYLTKSQPKKIYANRVGGDNKNVVNNDNIAVIIKFNDGSIGNIVYTGSGDRSFSREMIEVFCEGKTIVIKDFRKTEYYFNGRRKTYKTNSQDMGYISELQNFVNAIKGEENLRLTIEEIYSSTLGVFKIKDSIRSGLPQIF